MVELGFDPRFVVLLQILVSYHFVILPLWEWRSNGLEVEVGDCHWHSGIYAAPLRELITTAGTILCKGRVRDSGKAREERVDLQLWNIGYNLNVPQQDIGYMTYCIILW